MNGSTILKMLLIGSVLMWMMVVVSISINILLVPDFSQVGHLTNGCYRTDAMLIYVECSGFTLAPIASKFLTLPYLLPFGPILIVFNPIVGIPMWFFLLFPVWYFWDKWRHTKQA